MGIFYAAIGIILAACFASVIWSLGWAIGVPVILFGLIAATVIQYLAYGGWWF